MKKLYKFIKSYFAISLILYITGAIISASWSINEWYVACRTIIAFFWFFFMLASSLYPHDNN